MMAEYGEYFVLPDGALKDPETKAKAIERLLKSAQAVEELGGIKLGPIDFPEMHHVPRFPPSRKVLEEAGVPQEEIDFIMAEAEKQEWPQYEDSIAWHAFSIEP